MSSEELFDVVDADDRPVRVETRRDVHANKWLHRAVHIFVFNAAGELYLQRRSMTKDSAPGKWVSSCSGHVDSGESYDEAARRELGEEIGLYDPSDLTPLFKERPCDATGHEFVWVYRCSSEGPFVLDENEVMDGKWIRIQDLESWLARAPRDFAWSFSHLWALYRSFQSE